MTAAVYRALRDVLRRHGEEAALVGDEGGYGPRLPGNAAGFERILEAIEAAGLRPVTDVAIALDVAATHFFDPASGGYRLHRGSEAGVVSLAADAWIETIAGWVDAVPALLSLEDALAEDDWDAWTALTARLGGRVQLIGDDLFCTQTARIQRGIDRGAANAVLIKLNQVGTLSETLDALLLARRHGLRAVVSARSGETEDTFIADLAVATGVGQIKIGALARSERGAKYNRLLRIEEQLGGAAAPFAGSAVLGS
jgi:enolase